MPNQISSTTIVTAGRSTEDVSTLLSQGGWPNTDDLDLQQLVATLNNYDTVGSFRSHIISGQQYIIPTYQTEPVATEAEVPPVEDAPPPKPGTTYIWVKHDNIWDVARRLGFSGKELMEHNDIDDPDTLKPGDTLHLPIALPMRAQRDIRYEVLPEPRDMHVVKEGSCKKWAFGNVRTWDDFKASGFYPESTNIKIVATAHVPVDDKDPEAEAGFYMDAIALGDYQNTGRVQYTIGFRWTDLAEGLAERVTTVKRSQEDYVEALAAEATDTTPTKSIDITTAGTQHDKDGFDPQFVQQRLETSIEEGSHDFVKNYQGQDVPTACMAIIPDGIGEVDVESGRHYVWIKDYATKRPDRRLFNHSEVLIGGTFEIDGVFYGRPEKAAKNGYWFGIPADLLQSQADVYNDKLDAETRAEVGKLTTFEQYFWVPVSKLVHRKNKN